MARTSNELVEIAKLNGDFKRNYGKLLGALLYLCSIDATRGRSLLTRGFFVVALSAVVAWFKG